MNEFLIFEEDLKNESTGENVKGIRIMVDGEFKQVLDKIIENNPDFVSYSEVIASSVTHGITKIIAELKKGS